MKKVFIIHGFKGKPNGVWRPWLLEQLNNQNIYACTLPMPHSEAPICLEWISVIDHAVSNALGDEIYLVGHSLGVRAIMRYLESDLANNGIAAAVLISGRIGKSPNQEITGFDTGSFKIDKIKNSCNRFVIIHGDNDPFVSVENAYEYGRLLNVEPEIVHNGGHFDREAGYLTFPKLFEEIMHLVDPGGDAPPTSRM